MGRALLALGLLLGLLLATPARAITRDEVLARAQAWVDAGVPYSWDAWYTDPTSGSCCYRSDCSGYVSAVWGIAPPGNTTYSFAGGPWDDGVSYEIAPSELLPGDALNYPGDPNEGTGHMMLYVSGDFASGDVEVYEEYTHGEPATHRWREIDPALYLPIRFTGIEDCTTEVCDGADNDCDGGVDEDWLCELPAEPALSAWRHDRGTSSDIDGDGAADVCARGAAGLYCARSAGGGFSAVATLEALSNAEGFDESDHYSTLRLADVDGDGMADACARGGTGFRCWRATGAGFGEVIEGPELSDAAGWSDVANYSTLRMADLDGDGRTDLCARADAGLLCWLSDGSALSTQVSGPAWSDALGWSDPMYYSTIRMADVDGDGRTDVCARASAGVECWRFDGSAFSGWVGGPELSNALGWDAPQYYGTIAMPDVDGDGRSDLCARGVAGMLCWRSNGAGFDPSFSGPELSDALGWDDLSYYATIRWGDVTGDGRDDVCARAAAGVRCWPSTGTGFGAALTGPELSDASGWGDPANFATFQLGDLDGDGLADACARADAGLRCWRATGAGFAGELAGPAWSDDLGWGEEPYYATFRLAGGGRPEVADSGGADSAAPDSGPNCGHTTEVCNGVDDDCDGAVDEGCPAIHADPSDSGEGEKALGVEGGCGCVSGDGAGAAGAAALAGVAGVLVGRRRRRAGLL